MIQARNGLVVSTSPSRALTPLPSPPPESPEPLITPAPAAGDAVGPRDDGRQRRAGRGGGRAPVGRARRHDDRGLGRGRRLRGPGDLGRLRSGLGRLGRRLGRGPRRPRVSASASPSPASAWVSAWESAWGSGPAWVRAWGSASAWASGWAWRALAVIVPPDAWQVALVPSVPGLTTKVIAQCRLASAASGRRSPRSAAPRNPRFRPRSPAIEETRIDGGVAGGVLVDHA